MKKFLSLLVAVMMMLACAVPVFAEDGDDDTPSVVRIPEGTKVVTSSTLDDGVIERLRVKTIYVPSSVTTIKEGALTGYANVTNVYVENSKDNITIESGAPQRRRTKSPRQRRTRSLRRRKTKSPRPKRPPRPKRARPPKRPRRRPRRKRSPPRPPRLTRRTVPRSSTGP